jgi:GNAT superfamily N-acetyltransferase
LSGRGALGLAVRMSELVRVDPLDPGQDALFRAWVAVYAAAGRAVWGEESSAWSAEEVREFQKAPERRRTALAAVLGGAVVGAVQVIETLSDNPGSANVWLAVHPDHWRAGVGSQLLTAAEGIVTAAGRTTVIDHSESPERSGGPAAAFAARHGYAAAQRGLRSDLRLPLDPAVRAAFEAVATDPGYVIETAWDELPEAWLADRAVLSQRMSTDAPLGDLALEEEAWDAERVRRYYARMRSMGRRVVVSVARHLGSGRLVGYTDLAVPADRPTLGYQQDTLVLREHRGHGLGLALKRANLAAVQAELPRVSRVRTWNAETNEPMLRVNRALGFEVTGFLTEWQKRL